MTFIYKFVSEFVGQSAFCKVQGRLKSEIEMPCQPQVGDKADGESREETRLAYSDSVIAISRRCGEIHKVDSQREPEMEKFLVVVRINLCIHFDAAQADGQYQNQSSQLSLSSINFCIANS